jgi:6-phospho-beta-glucosidase
MLARAKALSLSNVTVYDSNASRLRTITGVIDYLRSRYPEVAVTETCEYRDFRTTRADCAIISIRPGLEAGRAADEVRAKKQGLLANETVGAAGLVFACRAIPEAVRLAGILKENNPRCLIINFTNPSGLVTSAIQRAGISTAYGVCSSAEKAVRLLRQAPGLGDAQWRPQVFGLNHLSWTYSVLRDGSEYLQTVLNTPGMLSVAQPWFDSALPRRDHALLNEYLHYYYEHETEVARQAAETRTRGEFIERLNKRLRRQLANTLSDNEAASHYLEYVAGRKHSYMRGTDNDSATARFNDDDGYSAPAISLIEAVILRRTRYLTCISTGDSPGWLPSTTGLEATRLFRDGAPGASPSPELTPAVRDLIGSVANYESEALAAITAKSFSGLVDALGSHPLVSNRAVAAAFLRSSAANWPRVFRSWRDLPRSDRSEVVA